MRSRPSTTSCCDSATRLNLTSRAQLSANATRVDKAGSPTAWEGFASLTLALGWRTVASAVTTVDKEGEALTSVNLQRSLPLGPGFGFRIDADAQDPYRTQGIFEAQGRRGIIGVRAGRLSRTTRRSAPSTSPAASSPSAAKCCCRGRWTTGLRW